jgi:hypothetical protein
VCLPEAPPRRSGDLIEADTPESDGIAPLSERPAVRDRRRDASANATKALDHDAQ